MRLCRAVRPFFVVPPFAALRATAELGCPALPDLYGGMVGDSWRAFRVAKLRSLLVMHATVPGRRFYAITADVLAAQIRRETKNGAPKGPVDRIKLDF